MKTIQPSLLACLLVAGLAAQPARAQTEAFPNTRAYLDYWSRYYESEKPEAETEEESEGDGFFPFQRYRNFVESRMAEGEVDLPAGARARAFEQLKALEASKGRAGETWFNLGPSNFSGRALAIEVDPTNSNVVYVGSASGGLWKTIDGGTSWTPMGDNWPTLAISCLEIDENDHNHLWIGTGEGWGNTDAIHGVGLLESFDGGATFNTTGIDYVLSQGRDVLEIAHNPTTNTLLVGLPGSLQRSTDGGATFTAVQTLGRWTDIEYKRGSSSIVFASSFQWAGFGFYRSTDDGATWTQITNGTPTSTVFNNRFCLTDADPNVIYWGVYRNGTTMGIWKSADGGDSFTQVFTGTHYNNQGWYNVSIDVSQTDPNRVFSGGVDFYRSTNGGTSFSLTATNVHADHHATEWDPSNPNRFWIGCDGGVWLSTNDGQTFTDKNTGLITCQFYAMGQSESMPTRALGGTQDNGTWVYNNSTSWAKVLGGDGFQCEVDRANANVMYAELYFGDHYKTTNGGTTFLPRNSGIGEDGPWETPTWLDVSDNNHLYAAHNTKVWQTTNAASSWFTTTVTSIGGGGRAIHQSLSNPDVLVVLGSAFIWVTTDHGATWENRTNGLVTASTLSCVRVAPNDPNTIVVGLKTYSGTIDRLVKSTDQGASWFSIDAGLPVEPVNAIEIDPSNPNTYFCGTDLGVYLSLDAGATWTPFNNGLPHVVCEDLRIHDDTRIMRVATHGRGLWEVDITNVTTTAVNEVPVVEPLLLRVFGNPASKSTLLRFGLRAAGQVRLDLYDAQGRLVRNLRDGWMPVMIDDVRVDLSGLAAGVYWARLQANGATVSRQLVVER